MLWRSRALRPQAGIQFRDVFEPLLVSFSRSSSALSIVPWSSREVLRATAGLRASCCWFLCSYTEWRFGDQLSTCRSGTRLRGEFLLIHSISF